MLIVLKKKKKAREFCEITLNFLQQKRNACKQDIIGNYEHRPYLDFIIFPQ